MVKIIDNILKVLRETKKDFIRNLRFVEYQKVRNDEEYLALFRKTCHILDKGINYLSFEKGHSVQVYKNALHFRDDLQKKFSYDPSFIWCCSVISEYERLQKDGDKKYEAYVKYDEDSKNEYLRFICSRVSCRNFTGDVISKDIIRNIVKYAMDAPNGCCRQTTRFYVTQNIEIIKQTILNISGITCFSNIPCIFIITSFERPYKLIDKNLAYVDASLASQNLLLAARAYNIFGTICNCFQMSEDQELCVRKLFNIKDDEIIVLAIALGYPVNISRKPERMNVQSVLNEIE